MTSTVYMLNPGGDLPTTQAAFEALFAAHPQWQVDISALLPKRFTVKQPSGGLSCRLSHLIEGLIFCEYGITMRLRFCLAQNL